MNFEEALKRLEEIAGIIEAGRCTLDESIVLYEEAVKLTAACHKQLKEAQKKVKDVSEWEKEA